LWLGSDLMVLLPLRWAAMSLQVQCEDSVYPGSSTT
jgi:hypothetical protein